MNSSKNIKEIQDY
jgi:hypothetical protein